MNEYARKLGEVLKTFNPQRMRKFINANRKLYYKTALGFFDNYDDQWLLGTMAKMIMNRNDMSEEYKSRAREILDEMGWDYEID